MKSLRIVFMGTPEFAIPTLSRIHASHHQIVGVVSQPDRPRGRGRRLYPTPIKEFALGQQMAPIFQPDSLKSADFAASLQALGADAFVVVAFRILPEIIFSMPPMGTINLHPSLLPKYRGAAPIHWSIIRGESTTGITTILLRKEIDAGNIVLQKEMPVYPDDTAGRLQDRLAPAGAELVLETLNLLADGNAQFHPQDDALVTTAPKLSKENCHICFAQPAHQVRNWIQGLSPLPGGFVYCQEQMLKLYRAEVVKEESTSELVPGTVVKADQRELWVACQPGIVAIQELQLQGRKRLPACDFLCGSAQLTGTIFK